MPNSFLKVLLIAAGCLASVSATAAPITLHEVDKGWYKSDGQHFTSNSNYIVGTNGPWRNFFVFDLSSISGSVTSAVLRLDNPSSGGNSGTYRAWSFEGNVNSLLAGTGGTAAYADLGSGTEFASTFLSGSTGTKVISLNGAALSAIAGASGLFVIGGSFTGGALFGNTHLGNPDTLLVLNVEPVTPVPAPGAILLIGMGLVGLGYRQRVK